MKLLLENWREYLKEGVEDFYKEIEYSGQKTLYDFDGDCEVMVMFETLPDGVDLSLIEIVGEGCLRKGYASEVMERIINAADKYNVRISLGIQPLDGKINREDLISWYEKYGFEAEHDDYETSDMVRFPKDGEQIQ
jgi:GNAT superfamily N-acetyltransferase